MQFFGVKKWYNRNVFSDTKLKYVCWKTCKVRKVFDWCGSTSFSTSSELRFVKWVKFFVRNCIVKWVIFFASFCWLWDFLLENLKIKKNSDDVHWNVWTNIKALHVYNNIFKKIILNMRFWIIYILDQISFFGTALRRFSQWFFLYFLSLANHGGRHFYSASPRTPHTTTIKKLPTAF